MNRNRLSWTLFILSVMLFCTWLLSINMGYSKIPMADIIRILLGNTADENSLVIMFFRLPRMMIAILVGAGFSLSGLVLQSLLKNDLADPGLIGINAGAGLVVLIFIFVGGQMNFVAEMFLPLLAFLGASLTGMLIYFLSKDKVIGLNPMKMVLNGVAIQAGLNALMMFSVLRLDETQHDMLSRWQGGSIWRSNWDIFRVLLPWIVIGYVIIYMHAKYLDALSLGDTLAIGIGVPLKKVKFRLVLIAIAIAAASVALSGSMSFVGLIGPHIAKRLFGIRHCYLIPGSALIGAMLVLVADTIGRVILLPMEIPAGTVVAIIGAPYFLTLMIRKSNI